MTTPGEGESIDKRQQAAKDMLDDLIEQSGAESTGEEYEIVDALAEGTEDSPVEITESGLKLNLNFGEEEEYSEVAPEEVSAEELAALAAVEAELNLRWPETKLEPSLNRIEMLMDLLGNPERSFDVIQVAGTNGKSSTSRMIDALLRGFRPRDEPCRLEHLEVLGDRGTADRQRLRKLTRTLVSFAQPIDDRPTSRVGQRREDEIHTHLSIPLIK